MGGFGAIFRWLLGRWGAPAAPPPALDPPGVFRRSSGQGRTFRRGAQGRTFRRQSGAAPSGIGRTFRRAGQGRTFRRPSGAAPAGIGRVFRRSHWHMTEIPYAAIPRPRRETVARVFDFSNCPEVAEGQTLLASPIPTVTGLDGAALPVALSVGTPAVTAADFERVPAGKGVKVSIAGGVRGTDYVLECTVTLSGGGTRVVRGTDSVC